MKNSPKFNIRGVDLSSQSTSHALSIRRLTMLQRSLIAEMSKKEVCGPLFDTIYSTDVLIMLRQTKARIRRFRSVVLRRCRDRA